MPTDRAEHLEWAKARAMSHVEEGELHAAVSSMISDLTKHEQLMEMLSTQLGQNLISVGRGFAELGTASDVKKWIEGFK